MISLWLWYLCMQLENNLVLSDVSLNAKYPGHNIQYHDQDAEKKPHVFCHFVFFSFLFWNSELC